MYEEPLAVVVYELEELVGETVAPVDHLEVFAGLARGQRFAMMCFRSVHDFVGEAGEV